MGLAEAIDPERQPPPGASPEAAVCSICLDPVVARARARSIAKLQCGHDFHLDCIGSAFNAKGAMQCPNCRKVEKGCWLYANGHQPSSNFEIDDEWLIRETNNIISEHPFTFPWSHYGGFTSLPWESESEPTSFGDHSSDVRSFHCPHSATDRYHHPMRVHSGSTSSTESIPLDQRPTGIEGHAAADLSHVQVIHETDPGNHETEHQYLGILPVSGIPNHSTGTSGLSIPSYDGNNQQSSRPYIHAHPLIHRPTPRRGRTPDAQLGPASTVVSEARGQGHGMRGHFLQEMTPSTMPSNLCPPTSRRVLPRAFSTAASSSTETGGPHYCLTASANTSNNSLPNGEGPSRRADRPYNREWKTLWTPSEGELYPRGGAFSPVNNQEDGSSAGRSGTELLSMYRVGNGHQPAPPQGMPPFM